jgi:hypothetical protein
MAATPGPGPAGTNLLYDTAVLAQVVPNLKRPTKFLLDKFFTNIINSDTEFLAIDVDVGKRRMAPFVSPLVEGKLVEQRRMQTNVFKPPYIKDKRAPDLRKPVRRMIGEHIGGEMSGAEREMANIEFEMTDQIDMIDRRLEWMAAQVLSTGTVLVKGEGFPTSLVDFGRSSSLTVSLTGSAEWTTTNVLAGNASPSSNIDGWLRQILKESGGSCTDLIFTSSAWQGFIADPLLKGAIFYPNLGETGNAIDVGSRITKGAIYRGRWGQFDLWEYNEWYVDQGTEGGNADQEYPMLVDGTIVMCGADMMGTRGFATIMDPDFNYASLPYAPKTWTEKDPAQRLIMMQSSPLIIPSRVNASFAATVCPSIYN